MTPWRLGVDTGGTFTDIVAIRDGEIRTGKVPSTPPDFEKGVLSAIAHANVGLDDDVAVLAHGTTVTTNALITKTGARTGLITTRGFRDLLELRRGDRGELFDLMWDPPPPLVPRRLRIEVAERINYAGEVITPLHEQELRASVKKLREKGIEALAICFLNSYKNPAHEHQAREVVREIWPEVHVSVSSDLLREPREFERTATAVANAYVAPILSAYVESLLEKLSEGGFKGRLMIMHSGGGLFPAETCLGAPARTVTSGPAAGVMAAEGLASLTKTPNMLSLDMGGTSADIAVIRDGKARLVEDYSPEWGVPIRFPAVDLLTIGAGGGSIAWVEPSTGTPKVGPDSAGAVPGPACYGAGGTDATVTDANLLLGRLADTTRLAGTLALDADLATKSVERFARAIGLSVEDAALGIIEIANSNMAKAVRVMTVERGLDPRWFTLLAFGGAGPMHACELADQLGMPRAMVPVAPGVTSALGTMFVDIVHDLSQSHITLLRDARPDEIEAIFAELESRAGTLLDSDLVHKDDQVLERSLDLRYVGQGKALNCPIAQVNSATLSAAAEGFLREYERRYQHTAEGVEIELSVVRVRGRGLQMKPSLPSQSDGELASAERTRPVVFRGYGPLEVPVLSRESLGARASLRGPLVVEQLDSTTVVPPGWSLATDEYGNILLTKDSAARPSTRTGEGV